MEYYLSIDLGATSGRHIISHLDGDRLVTEEVYRFQNGAKIKNGYMTWDHEEIFSHVISGMKRCAEIDKIPSYMAIDTWGVDYVLLDGADRIIGDSIAYRDSRTNGMDRKLAEYISESELYKRTGIQKQLFNTIYQLLSENITHPDRLRTAESFLMMPDYLNFRLTGVKHQEYTMATTTQLVNIGSADWDRKLISLIGLPDKLFGKLSMPGDTVGKLCEDIAKEIGYDLTVLHCASHDTASAVLAIPTNSDNAAYLSSGTWSLIGIETKNPFNDETSMRLNYTNEGGYDHRYRYLKNIMGLWMISSIKRELKDRYSYGDLADMARENSAFPLRIDVNAPVFLAPASMIGAIKSKLGINASLGEIVSCVYHSLADEYAKSLNELSARKTASLDALHIIGGGAKDIYLSELTAKRAGIPVYAGPTEATAIGNTIAQMLRTGLFTTLSDARECVFRSFDVKKIK